MKQLGFITLLCLLAVFTLPFIAGGTQARPAGQRVFEPQITEDTVLEASSPSPAAAATPEQSARQRTDAQITVSINIGGTTKKMDMASYLFGVLAAEMPASFPEEALKAQAVAARTFALHQMRSDTGDAELSDDPDTCAAYISEAQARDGWGENAGEYVEKIKQAVSETDGVVILYQEEPILAVFHSTSSGMTENASDVWGGSVPYLVSVQSPGEDASPRYYGRAEVNPEEFKEAFIKSYPEAELGADPSAWFAGPVCSEAGGVKSVSVGGVSVSGAIIRAMCGLNSTHFTVTFENDMLVFQSVGYGHGVGMSQYGAKELALEGKDYTQIIKWYYSGVTLSKADPGGL